ncbi:MULTISPECIES: PadR family transcriptional regulator [Paenibacillus]|uniref:DNA-binding PadR family transcriptional regulator n=1 Tax=Paenibacillus brasilensis TaxID=128574 RepID=A0ABU0L6T1_9BACL|nr:MULTISPECIES: PadR family transcriptional regulator [Paenibacillus]MDQ0496984.1 DNA-binding PadR family transcriptional regulator [Paenibacillus brasilensis]
MKRTLKYAILGLVHKQEMSGYDITSQFKQEIGQFWSAKHSQIYPELKRLTEEKLIEYRTSITGAKLEKKLYCITPKGTQELTEWLLSPKELPETEKDEFMLMLYFSAAIPKEENKRLFEDQIAKRKEKLEYLYESKKSLQLLDKNLQVPGSHQFGHYLVLSRAINREESYITWLEETLSLFE